MRQSYETVLALRDIKRGLSPYAAAKKHGIALSTIYRALGREENKPALKAARKQQKARRFVTKTD